MFADIFPFSEAETGFERIELIQRMAERFKVSKKAMEYRLVNLALIGPPDDND
jgi:hypothetical protein